MFTLNVISLVLYTTLWLAHDNAPSFVHSTDILFVPNGDHLQNEMLLSILYNSRHSKACAPKRTHQLIHLLLILSGQIELNPGPRTVKFPCGECFQAVKWGQKAIACDSCDQWYHKTCIEMNSILYDNYEDNADLSWECCNCGVKNISLSLFNSTLESSTNSSLSPPRDNNTQQKRTPKQLRILCINFQSLWDKKEQLDEALLEEDIDIVIGSETHLDPCHKSSELLPPTYKCYRRDRKDTKGGVIIIVKKELITEEVKKSDSCELISIKIQTHKQPIIITSCYRPPMSPLTETSNICNEIKTLTASFKNNPHWFGGDTNLPDIDWENNSIVGHQYAKIINESFLDTFDDCGLEQIVRFPTRINNTLDIVATNRPTFVNRCIAYPGLSDHNTSALVDIVCHPIRSKPTKHKIFLWNRADKIPIKNQIRTEIANFINNHTIDSPVNEMWRNLTHIIENAMLSVPSKFTSTRYSQPWLTRKCKQLSRRKKRAYNRAKRTNRTDDWEKFKHLTRESRKACKSAFNEYVKKCVCPDDNINPKKLFRFIKSRKCENDGVAPLRDSGHLHIDDAKKANILNNQFSSVFSKPDDIVPPLIGPKCKSMPEINITSNGVTKLLNELNPNKVQIMCHRDF